MQSGAIVANGTDVPVERIDPMASFHATVTRKTKDGSVFYGDQKMTRARGAEVVHLEWRVCGEGRIAEGIARGRQARRHHGAVERHHDRARG